MAREIVLRPKGRLTAPWLAQISVGDGVVRQGREVVAEGVVRVTVKDTDVQGLELRIGANGARSWAVSKRVDGVQRRFTIPDSDRLTLAEARAAGEALRADVRRGGDPTRERREARERAKLARVGIGSEHTIRTLLDRYGELVALPAKQRSWEERRGHVLRKFKDLADLPLGDLTAGKFQDVLDRAMKPDAKGRVAKVSAWHGLRYLRTVLVWALGREMIDRDPTARLPLKDLGKRMKERARDRVLAPDELGRLWRAFEANDKDVYSCVLRVAALTAQRRGEVTAMRWADLDLDRGVWRQPTNKSDRPHEVPLSAAALAIVRAQPRRPGVPLVFTTSAGGPLARQSGNFRRATVRYSEAAGVRGWTPHDLRRTAATILAEAKVPSVVVEQLLNHAEGAGKGSSVAGIYNRFSYGLEKRQAVDLLAERVETMAREEGARIIEIRPTAAGQR